MILGKLSACNHWGLICNGKLNDSMGLGMSSTIAEKYFFAVPLDIAVTLRNHYCFYLGVVPASR